MALAVAIQSLQMFFAALGEGGTGISPRAREGVLQSRTTCVSWVQGALDQVQRMDGLGRQGTVLRAHKCSQTGEAVIKLSPERLLLLPH